MEDLADAPKTHLGVSSFLGAHAQCREVLILQTVWVLDGICLLCPLRSSFQLNYEEYTRWLVGYYCRGCYILLFSAGWLVIICRDCYILLGLLQISITSSVPKTEEHHATSAE